MTVGFLGTEANALTSCYRRDLRGHAMTQFNAGLLGLALTAAAAMPLSAMASAFFGWQVTDVAPGDLLNVRAYPSDKSRVLVGYPNGTRLSLTGTCKGLHLDTVSAQPEWRQRQAVRSRWCEVWLDPDGSGRFQAGWVYGRYIRPL